MESHVNSLPFPSFSSYFTRTSRPLQIGVTIVDDNQWEPDEEFFLKLTLLSGHNAGDVKLGRTSIMEITILNDDGELEPQSQLCDFINRFYQSPELSSSRRGATW